MLDFIRSVSTWLVSVDYSISHPGSDVYFAESDAFLSSFKEVLNRA